MKLCVECKHCLSIEQTNHPVPGFDPDTTKTVKYYTHLCTYPDAKDMVNGDPKGCYEVRENSGLCGQTARWWEPKNATRSNITTKSP